MTRYTPLWLQQGAYAAGEDRRLIYSIWPEMGCRGGDFSRTAGTLNAVLSTGAAAVQVAGPDSAAHCTWDAPEPIVFTAPPAAGSNRTDLVCLVVRGNDLDGGADNDFVFQVIAGTPGAPGQPPPAAPPNSMRMYAVELPGGGTSLDNATVTDLRPSRLEGAAGPAGGDLSGSYPDPIVDGIAGKRIDTAWNVGGNGSLLQYIGISWVYTRPNPAAGDTLIFDGTQWVPQPAAPPFPNMNVIEAYPAADIVAGGYSALLAICNIDLPAGQFFVTGRAVLEVGAVAFNDIWLANGVTYPGWAGTRWTPTTVSGWWPATVSKIITGPTPVYLMASTTAPQLNVRAIGNWGNPNLSGLTAFRVG